MIGEKLQARRFDGEDGYYVIQIMMRGWADYYISHIDYGDLMFCFGVKEEDADDSYVALCFDGYLDLVKRDQVQND